MRFLVHELVGLKRLAELPQWAEITPELLDQILDEAARFAEGVLSPLNAIGDRIGSIRSADGNVTTPPGFKEAYQQFLEAGWNSIVTPEEFGGQGLPRAIGTPVSEMWHGSNVAFTLCPLLTQGAIEAIHIAGSEALKQQYLPRMVSGEWAGTMNLTEPQAGSDLAALRTKAISNGDHYLLHGQKIYITYGEQDFTSNIIHLVLARTPDAPAGVKGISLFLVPKFLVNEDGSLGARNDVHCVSLENKLGIHASPTCVMTYGDQGGAIGFLVGEENRGLEYMFIMMNAARFSVGMEGVGLAEAAYQHALRYARERVQGTPMGTDPNQRLTILGHPDVRRMLLTMRAHVEAGRAMAYQGSLYLDLAAHHPDPSVRADYQSRVDVFIPVIKAWNTEMAVNMASLGIQVHGGMGYIEETGAAQFLRDARITSIYEGTTGIQCIDLIGRKVMRDQGCGMFALLAELEEWLSAHLLAEGEREGRLIHAHLKTSALFSPTLFSELKVILNASIVAVQTLKRATEWVVATSLDRSRHPEIFAGAFAYLKLTGNVLGGVMMAKAAHLSAQHLSAEEGDVDFFQAKIRTAHFFALHVLSENEGHLATLTQGGQSIIEFPPGAF
jgi:alkylation response protein AidB-like acyl-CoA dehydrogenase